MNKKLLGCALVAGLSMAQSVVAQDYDDRFYITAGAGVGFFDNAREVENKLYGTFGFGKFISPNISLDAELWHSNPKLTASTAEERNWELMSLELVGRYHFIQDGRSWNPYIAAGIGAQEHHDGTQTQPVRFGYNKSRVDTNFAGLLGVGVQKDLGYASIRGELGARFDMDDNGRDGDNSYMDGYAGVSFLFPIGAESAPAPEPVVVAPAPQPTCADQDDGCAVPAPEPAPEPVLEPKPFRG